MEPVIYRPTKTGQPVMGSKITLGVLDGASPLDCRVVGKLWGRGGSADLVGIIVEEWDKPLGRITLVWPLEPRSA